MKEYGRNIQKMIEYLLSLEDEEQRQGQAMALIELMGTLNPHLRNVEDFRHKLWDHLFLISDFKLNVESPYPIPTRETLKYKPEKLTYPKKYPKLRHFGKNLEMVIDKALHEENPEKKEGFTQCIGNYMKLAYSNWHKESVHDDAVRSELNTITNGQLEYHAGTGSSHAAPAVFSGGNTGNEFPRSGNVSGGGGGSMKRKSFQQNKFKSNNGKAGGKHSNNKYNNKNRNK